MAPQPHRARRLVRPALWLTMALAVWLASVASSFLAAAEAAPSAPLGHSGRWITDARDRVLILHGAAVVIGGFGGPETPEQAGFTAADAGFMADQGLKVVRLGIFDQYLERAPGTFDDAYLDSIARTQKLLADEGIVTVLDLHQDLLAGKYAGRGFGDWFPIDDGVPNLTQFGFPTGYLFNPAVNRAYDNLWANVQTADGLGGIDHIAAAWKHIARRFSDAKLLLGYDMFNEPWPGSQYASCVGVQGCPPGGFDQTALTAFFKKVVKAIRQVDPSRLVFAEPNLQFDFGAATGLGKLDDPAVGLSFHDYCLNYVIPNRPDPGNNCKETGETFVFQNADAYAQRTGAALLMTEFGDTPEPAPHRRITELADKFMVGWTDWAYLGSSGNAKKNDAKPPTSDNLNTERLEAIVRPYPQAVAGTPLSYDYNEQAKRFVLRYSTLGPTGRDFSGSSERTEIFVPSRVFGSSYRVRASGSEVLPSSDPQLVELRSCDGVRTVSVTVTNEGPISDPGCPPAVATLSGNRLFIRLRCPRSSKRGSCRIRAVAVTRRRRGKRMTRTTTARLKAGKSKLVPLRVRSAYASTLATKKTVLVRERIRVNGKTQTVYKPFTLRRAR